MQKREEQRKESERRGKRGGERKEGRYGWREAEKGL